MCLRNLSKPWATSPAPLLPCHMTAVLSNASPRKSGRLLRASSDATSAAGRSIPRRTLSPPSPKPAFTPSRKLSLPSRGSRVPLRRGRVDLAQMEIFRNFFLPRHQRKNAHRTSRPLHNLQGRRYQNAAFRRQLVEVSKARQTIASRTVHNIVGGERGLKSPCLPGIGSHCLHTKALDFALAG